ncbi:ABC transporter permease [Helicobacter pylori]|uniref:ABC transporter permease n=1 Tax=Helicobacter pylori TaxID=210 RepID=UPI000EB57B4D|nr:ABC transporter permease [Helicobacter pylori]WQT43951.1 ABC transporter permease [Helicobacter pylori]WRD54085.1 ABC transporter permease [Helicobacter pylori]
MPNRSLIFFLIKRYLRFDKSQPFISITALLAFFGVAVGVMVLIVAMAIMNGMSKEFEKKLFVMNYPLTLYTTSPYGISEEVVQALEKKFPNLLFSPYLQTQSLIKSAHSMNGGVVFGVDFSKERRINEVLNDALKNTNENDLFKNPFNLIVGKSLRYSLNLDLNQKADLFFTELEPTGLTLSPIMKRFTIKGDFDSGLKSYDMSYMYSSLQAISAIRRLPLGLYDGVHVYSKTPMKDIEILRNALKTINHHGIGIEGWWQQNGNFFSAMELEKRALFIVLMLIILMASLNIISSLLMVVMNRRKEIALLFSMGSSQKEIQKTFFYLGNIIGLGGVALGVVLAFLSMYLLSVFPIISLPADVYGINTLPLDLSLMDFTLTLIGSIIIVGLSSYYPSKKASHIDALSVLRNE